MPKTQSKAADPNLDALFKTALEEAKGQEADPGFRGLPGGIDNGVAIFAGVKFETHPEGHDHAGEQYARLSAKAVSPKTHDGEKVEGLYTNIRFMFHDTGTGDYARTKAQNVANFLNCLKLLNVIDDDNSGCATLDDIQAHITSVIDSGEITYLRFRTSTGQQTLITEEDGQWIVTRGNKRIAMVGSEEEAKARFPYAGRPPMVFHNWDGAIDYTPPEEQSFHDKTAPDVSEKAGFSGGGKDDGPDLASLAQDADSKRASKKRKEAQDLLETLAEDAGVDASDVEGAENWAEVVQMIRDAE